MNDYHDYVFKDSNLIGKFEEMYKDCEDPWFQSNRINEQEIKIMCDVMLYNTYNKVLDIGCGIGHVSNLIKEKCNKLDAFDISKTAIDKAKILYPDINFFVFDIFKIEELKEKYDLIILSGTLWYVVDDIDNIFMKINDLLKENGEFFLTLPFPDTTKKFYGDSIIKNENDLIDKFCEFFNYDYYMLLNYKEKKNSPVLQIKGNKKI